MMQMKNPSTDFLHAKHLIFTKFFPIIIVLLKHKGVSIIQLMRSQT